VAATLRVADGVSCVIGTLERVPVQSRATTSIDIGRDAASREGLTSGKWISTAGDGPFCSLFRKCVPYQIGKGPRKGVIWSVRAAGKGGTRSNSVNPLFLTDK
jgi:hypothetical protein